MNKDAHKAAKKLLPLYHEHAEPWTQHARSIASCQRGCNHCCYQLIGTSLAEGALIAAHLMDSPSWMPELQALRVRLQQDSDDIRAMSGTKSKSYQWMENKKGCPFLDKKSGDCRIYNVRPIACRTYFVVSDPDNCSPDKPGAEVRIIDPSHAQVPLINAIVGLEAIPTLTGSMQSMVLAGMELISHSSGHFRKWMAGRQIDDLATPDELLKTSA